MDLPGIIGERMFNLSDKNKDGFLNLLEFSSSILKINSNDPDIKMRLIFDLYDFDNDGKIKTEDIKTIMGNTLPSNNVQLSHDKSEIFDSGKQKEYKSH
jgi:Ca2+-binding EF-hand superfamily protein